MMFINSVKNVMQLLGSKDNQTDDGVHFRIIMHRESTAFYSENSSAEPTEENFQDAANFISEITKLHCSISQAKGILLFYPHVRIKMAVYNGITGTDVRDGLSGAVAHYFLGCEWPTFGDKADPSVFVEGIKKEAIHHGFSPLEVINNS
jgi:hypothetical protein